MLRSKVVRMADRLVTPAMKEEVPFKPGLLSRSLRVAVITSNTKKFEEFREQLGDGYGMDVEQIKAVDANHFVNEEALTKLCCDIMQTRTSSPHFILREETNLVSLKDQADLTDLPIEALAKRELESVLHTSVLTVYKPQWSESKILSGFTIRQYEKRAYGYIKPDAHTAVCEYGFGWDAIFVNASTNLTNEEYFAKYGKKSARQHTISDFVETYLRYKALKSLQHHKLNLTRPIDFGDNYVSPAQFVRTEKHMSNPYLKEWGIDKLRTAMINEGLFFKAAWSRPVKNYFSPPFSGLPLTEKKDEAEETIFMTHDMLHHLVSDLICDLPPTQENFFVYSAWRMMSEACTLVLADMFYADSLIKSGVERSCVDKRIYPLFEAIKAARAIPDPAQMTNTSKIMLIKKLLSANIRFALLGDDSEWRTLLEQDGKIDPDHLKRLEAYKAHFGKFFIGDNAWTRANFDNMHKDREALQQWIDDIGRDTFIEAHIPLLSDVCHDLQQSGVAMDQYETLIAPLFEYLFTNKIAPHLAQQTVTPDADETIQSRAFRRFLIGQASLFSRYPIPLNLDHVKAEILKNLRSCTHFSNEHQNSLRKKLEQYILGIEGLRLMSRAEALNAIDCTSVFPPVYISYVEMQKRYTSIQNCVAECISQYSPPAAGKEGKRKMVSNAFLLYGQKSAGKDDSTTTSLKFQ